MKEKVLAILSVILLVIYLFINSINPFSNEAPDPDPDKTKSDPTTNPTSKRSLSGEQNDLEDRVNKDEWQYETPPEEVPRQGGIQNEFEKLVISSNANGKVGYEIKTNKRPNDGDGEIKRNLSTIEYLGEDIKTTFSNPNKFKLVGEVGGEDEKDIYQIGEEVEITEINAPESVTVQRK